jgi:hypothetical protein
MTMTATKSSTKRFPRLMTIGSVYQPVFEFLDGLPQRPVEDPLSPLDCYLIHLAIEFVPRRVAVVDLACESTWGSGAVVCLSNPRVGRVSSRAGGWQVSPGKRLDQLIADYAADAELPGAAAFTSIDADDERFWNTSAASLWGRDDLIVLLPSSAFEGPGDDVLPPIFEAAPEAVVLIVGNGRIGEDSAARRLVAALHGSSNLNGWFLREHSPSLASSGLVVVADKGNHTAAEIVQRIESTFTTNYDFLTIVRDSCLYALERGIQGELDPNYVGPRLLDSLLRDDDPGSPIIDSELRRDVARETIQRLQGRIRRLEAQVVQEENRPLAHSFMRRSARRVVHFGRRHRQVFAPTGSIRERMARSMIQMGRSTFRLS